MSLVSRALRDIDAQSRAGVGVVRHNVNLLRAYATSRGGQTSPGALVGAGGTIGWRAWVWLLIGVSLAGLVAWGWGRGAMVFERSAKRPPEVVQPASGQAIQPALSPPQSSVVVTALPDRAVLAQKPVAEQIAPPVDQPMVKKRVLAVSASPARRRVLPHAAKRSQKRPTAHATPARSRSARASFTAAQPKPTVAPVADQLGPPPVRPSLESVATLQAQARAALAAGETQEALAYLRSALQQDPQAHTARQALLAVLARGERGPAWLAALAEAVAVDPVRFGLMAARGWAEAGHIHEAMQALAAMPVGARQMEWYATHGLLAQRAGQHERAIDSLQRALEWAGPLSAKQPALRIALAESLSMRGEHAQARHYLADLVNHEAVSPELRALAARRLKALP